MTSLKRCKEFIDQQEVLVASNPPSGQPADETPRMRTFLSKDEWKAIDEIIDVMQPIYATMKKMQADSFSLSDFYGAWILIRVSLIQYSKKPNRLTDLPEVMLKYMRLHEPKLFMNPLLLAAVYLDPRFMHTLVGQQKAVARNIIEAIHNRDNEANVGISNNNSGVSTNGNQNDVEDLNGAFAAYLNEMAAESSLLPTPQSPNEEFLFRDDLLALEMEENKFEEMKMLPPKTNVLEFWETQKIKLPMLYKVSRTVMGVPSTQTIIERLFSSFAYILNARRTNMSPDLLQQILFIRGN